MPKFIIFITSLLVISSNTLANNCETEGGLFFLGTTRDSSQSLWLSGTNKGRYYLEAAQQQQIVDRWSRRNKGLHLSVSPVVSNGEGGVHKLYNNSSKPCLVASANQVPWDNLPPIEFPERPVPPIGILPEIPEPPIGILPEKPVPPIGVLPERPVPPIGVLPERPVPPIGVLPERPVPPIGVLPEKPVPPIGVLPERPVPPIGVLPEKPVPPIGVLPERPVPPIGVLPEKPVPPIGVLPERPVPPIGVLPEKPVPPIGVLPERPVPPIGVLPEKPVPPIGVLPERPVPPIGVLPEKPVPPIGILPERPVPPIGTLPSAPEPPIGGLPPEGGVEPNVASNVKSTSNSSTDHSSPCQADFTYTAGEDQQLASELYGCQGDEKTNEKNTPYTKGRENLTSSSWNTWFDVVSTNSDDNRYDRNAHSYQEIFTLGADTLLSENIIIGTAVNLTKFRGDSFDNTWTLDGENIYIQPYFAYRLSNAWSIMTTLGIGWSETKQELVNLDSEYDSSLLSINLSANGTYFFDDIVYRQTLSIFYAEEDQDDYTLSGTVLNQHLDILMTGVRSHSGTITSSNEISTMTILENGVRFFPFANLDISYDYDRKNDGDILASTLEYKSVSPWRGSITGGARFITHSNVQIELSTGYTSLGHSGLNDWQARFYISYGF